jgi:hypothetical protein
MQRVSVGACLPAVPVRRGTDLVFAACSIYSESILWNSYWTSRLECRLEPDRNAWTGRGVRENVTRYGDRNTPDDNQFANFSIGVSNSLMVLQGGVGVRDMTLRIHEVS